MVPEIVHGSRALALSRATFDKMNIEALGSDDAAFGGQLKLSMSSTFSGSPADWEESSWNFKAYVSMYETSALQGLDSAETREMPITDEDLVTTLDTGDRDEEATRKTLIFSRKLNY